MTPSTPWERFRRSWDRRSLQTAECRACDQGLDVPPPPIGTPEMAPAPRVLADVDRRLRCVGYSACLDYARRKGWESFTCARCEERREVRQCSEDERRDWHGLAMLLAAIFRPAGGVER